MNDRKQVRRHRQQFLLGAVFAFAIGSGFQDWYGLEGYIAYSRTHWNPVPWWLWGVLVVGVLVASALLEPRDR